MDEDRICEIETRLAFQEDHLQELNSLVAKQAREIEVLREQLLHAYKKLNTFEGGQNQPIENEETPPPHY